SCRGGQLILRIVAHLSPQSVESGVLFEGPIAGLSAEMLARYGGLETQGSFGARGGGAVAQRFSLAQRVFARYFAIELVARTGPTKGERARFARRDSESDAHFDGGAGQFRAIVRAVEIERNAPARVFD